MKPIVLSASTLSGNTVRNPEGENLGSIKDFMIDIDTGHIAYAVLSFGGFLGMGDKLFAIPYEVLQLDTDNHAYVLNVDKETLKEAPGFDKDNWPSEPNYVFVNRIYDYYGLDPYYGPSGESIRRSRVTV